VRVQMLLKSGRMIDFGPQTAPIIK
jgi:hypothetical protein